MTASALALGVLTADEETALAHHEDIIARGVHSFVETGLALAAVRDARLYRADFATFEDYCDVRWGWHRSRAFQLMDGAIFTTRLSTMVDNPPQHERHVRELLPLRSADDATIEAVWREVESTAPPHRRYPERPNITTKHVRGVVGAHLRSNGTSDAAEYEEPTRTFNRQVSDNIEWARWSWNPVTGCLHDCSYCYARDIANRFYPEGFAPTFHPERLGAPAATRVPAAAANEPAERQVFVCSMADLFGRWVPREWIDAVLERVRANPQWTYLFLTKFPNRLAEFDFPDHCWVGTSIDAQARIPNAERALRGVRAGARWYSCEPLLEPLRFSDLSFIDWIVVGGASESRQTPAFRPPRAWVLDLERQADAADCRVYEKTNLWERRREYPGVALAPATNVPAVFKMRYLQRDVIEPAAYAVEMTVEH